MRQAFDDSLTTSFYLTRSRSETTYRHWLKDYLLIKLNQQTLSLKTEIKSDVIGFILKVFFLLHSSTVFLIKNDSKLVLHALLNGISNFTSRRELYYNSERCRLHRPHNSGFHVDLSIIDFTFSSFHFSFTKFSFLDVCGTFRHNVRVFPRWYDTVVDFSQKYSSERLRMCVDQPSARIFLII